MDPDLTQNYVCTQQKQVGYDGIANPVRPLASVPKRNVWIRTEKFYGSP